MSRDTWQRVDDWIADTLLGDDGAMDDILAANAAAGLPAIDVSAPQGKLLHLLVRLSRARRVLEVGTLGGYSTVWMARARPPDGTVLTLEVDAGHAAVAADNCRRAGVADRVELAVGPALATLERMVQREAAPFDFVFIDADKSNNAEYMRLALALSRPGTVLVCDNVVRKGDVLDGSGTDEAVEGTRALFDLVSGHRGLSATAVQTVGGKGWDGFLIALVQGDG